MRMLGMGFLAIGVSFSLAIPMRRAKSREMVLVSKSGLLSKKSN